MSGTIGDFLVLFGPGNADAAAQQLGRAQHWAPWPGMAPEVVHSRPAPGVQVWHRGDVHLTAQGELGGLGFAIEPLGDPLTGGDVRTETLNTWVREQRWSAQNLRGRFAYVMWDTRAQRLLACTDAFRSCTLYYAQTPHGLVVASDLRLIIRAGLVPAQVSKTAVYHYLNFSYVPAPLTAIDGIHKLPPGHSLESLVGRVSLRKYWDALYPEDLQGTDQHRANGLRDKIVETVRSYGASEPQGWGTFLSGGTDSSSIASILSRGCQSPVNSFSIGFEEDGYDELPYSRIASTAFGLRPHERRVSEQQALEIIPRLIQAYDEPFGNSSAIPTFYCAELAAQNGVNLLVGGDGGDEIFGGNERYRKDQIFNQYFRAPAPVRWLGSAVAGALGGVDHRIANRVKNFIRRGSMPNPDRFYSDDSFASDHYSALLTPEFRSAVGLDDSLNVQRAIYQDASTSSELHRLMYLDLKMTIADNDVVKVVRAAKLAGVQVVFPYLDRSLIDYTGRLPVRDKVRGLQKRFLFKLATLSILPEEIRKKKKQGFGLPVSVWLRRNGPFHAMARDTVLSHQAIQRGYCQSDFVRGLMERHERGAWDHAAEIYMLMMLELWHREYVDPLLAK
jgi:asparagine synthase (glutamine-hydrolysing)